MKNIFISSTFIDMQSERDMVQERVLPVLREKARQYGDNVGVIDLRWGVDTSTLETEEGAAKVLKVCLDEIDRSHPYMLIFFGERYGTVMREDQIKKSICGREDKYTTDDYEKSITALEVEYGALSKQYGELNHCVVCFREPVAHMLDGIEKDLYVEQREERRKKLEALKERMKRELGEEGHLITYSCTWDVSAHQMVDFTSNGQPLEEVLTDCFVEMFQEDWKKYECLSWQDKEQLTFDALIESKLRAFVGREELLEEYYQSVVSSNCPIILQGEAGCGKTAIMCKLIERLQKEGKNVFRFFSGVGSMSTNAEYLVKQLVYYMENLLGIDAHFEEKQAEESKNNSERKSLSDVKEKKSLYDMWMERFEELCVCLPEEKKVYVCIDALDQLVPDEHVKKLDFFVKAKGIQVIASCTDEFVLPMEAVVSKTVKVIPTLSEADAKRVAEAILASYSRNAYAAIEAEILKKKSIGNPLYISLLIQRLNMMDAEELRKAMTEEEIIALGTGIIRKMPEETEEAIVAVIRDGIDKISDVEEVLYETLEYLAVSRNGLRMTDLQGIFVEQGRTLPTLDVTLLMKYLDSFFYIHGDGRIDFTHKVIRQGLRKGLLDRMTKEVAIKEHLKSLGRVDELRMQEGIYFARITKDEEFARELVGQAYLENGVLLAKAIKNEAIEDSGEFFCRLIEKETDIKSAVNNYFLWSMSSQWSLVKEEMQAELAIGKALANCLEKLHEEQDDLTSLHAFVSSYYNVGRLLVALGRGKEALQYLKKALECQERPGGVSYVQDIAHGYGHMGDVLMELGQAGEALTYYEKMLKEMEKLHEYEGSEASLWDLLSSYESVGDALSALGQLREAMSYYEKYLRGVEEFHEQSGRENSLDGLLSGYHNMGDVLIQLGQAGEALPYCEKLLACAKVLHEQLRSENSLRNLSTSYNLMGVALSNLGWLREALSYYEKALTCEKELYEIQGSEKSLDSLCFTRNHMGDALMSLGQVAEASLHYEITLLGMFELYKKSESEASLRDLLICYNNVGHVLLELNRIEEALPYYNGARKHAEKLLEKSGSEMGDMNEDSRMYVKIFRMVYLCANTLFYFEEAERYLVLLKEQAKKLYERAHTEEDRELLEEILALDTYDML